MSDEKQSQPEDQVAVLREKILSDAPRLGPQDTFSFRCQPGISCFNRCCADVNIFLAPYDVLRLRKRLGVSSTEFIQKYALMPIQKDMKTPVMVLKMNEDETKTCPFVSAQGCGVYSDRPWPCRMYPLGMAAQKDTEDGWQGERFYFLMKEEACQGFCEEPKQWRVKDWLDSQELDAYDEWGEAYKELTLHKFFQDGGTLTPEKMQMFFMACYDLDKFREFIFESTFLERFEVDEDFVNEMRHSEEALLRFGFLWLRFSLFGEKTVKVKHKVLEAYQGKLEKQKLYDKKLAKRCKEETR